MALKFPDVSRARDSSNYVGAPNLQTVRSWGLADVLKTKPLRQYAAAAVQAHNATRAHPNSASAHTMPSTNTFNVGGAQSMNRPHSLTAVFGSVAPHTEASSKHSKHPSKHASKHDSKLRHIADIEAHAAQSAVVIAARANIPVNSAKPTMPVKPAKSAPLLQTAPIVVSGNKNPLVAAPHKSNAHHHAKSKSKHNTKRGSKHDAKHGSADKSAKSHAKAHDTASIDTRAASKLESSAERTSNPKLDDVPALVRNSEFTHSVHNHSTVPTVFDEAVKQAHLAQRAAAQRRAARQASTQRQAAKPDKSRHPTPSMVGNPLAPLFGSGDYDAGFLATTAQVEHINPAAATPQNVRPALSMPPVQCWKINDLKVNYDNCFDEQQGIFTVRADGSYRVFVALQYHLTMHAPADKTLKQVPHVRVVAYDDGTLNTKVSRSLLRIPLGPTDMHTFDINTSTVNTADLVSTKRASKKQASKKQAGGDNGTFTTQEFHEAVGVKLGSLRAGTLVRMHFVTEDNCELVLAPNSVFAILHQKDTDANIGTTGSVETTEIAEISSTAGFNVMTFQSETHGSTASKARTTAHKRATVAAPAKVVPTLAAPVIPPSSLPADPVQSASIWDAFKVSKHAAADKPVRFEPSVSSTSLLNASDELNAPQNTIDVDEITEEPIDAASASSSSEEEAIDLATDVFALVDECDADSDSGADDDENEDFCAHADLEAADSDNESESEHEHDSHDEDDGIEYLEDEDGAHL